MKYIFYCPDIYSARRNRFYFPDSKKIFITDPECIFLLVCIVAGTAALYFWKGRKESVPKEGVLVQEMEDFVDDEVTA